MTYLVLVRHGLSEWNEKGLWTGRTQVNLAPAGVTQARALGNLLSDIPLHGGHVSELVRTQQTLDHLLDGAGQQIPIAIHPALNERDYGDYTGKNKWQVKDEVGDEEFKKIRRSWDHPIPGGESLKQVYERVVPYYETVLLKDLAEGKNTIISAHGNSLRALVKHLENIADHEIADLEFGHDEAHIYHFDGPTFIKKEIRRLPDEQN